ncbi:hypothetical protein TSUD_323890 [Trifolium subterraneum]|uniref:Reverse transcriptase domain-containing protein n=1 Tax=Trifolium subterraneum TaxID=3900 RepID=A0A2Z6NF17_TRISU|nr:hypothetical protein TSUD_323890 [Trifolium subterraneum]
MRYIKTDEEPFPSGKRCITARRSKKWLRREVLRPEVVLKRNSFSGSGFLGITVEREGVIINIVNIYSPCNISGKKKLWDDLLSFKRQSGGGEWCMGGDFNVVLHTYERKGSSAHSRQGERTLFNRFVEEMELIDVQVLGKKYSWFSADGNSMSRLDRFLLSDCFIVSQDNWGPKPFRVINGWLEYPEFLAFVEKSWKGFDVHGKKAFILKEKFKLSKDCLRKWNREVFGYLDLNIEKTVKDLNDIEGMMGGDDMELELTRREDLNKLRFLETDHFKESFLKQKSRMQWVKEEVREAIWSSDGNKCPRSDGFNFNFLKACWDIIKGDIMELLIEFHGSATLPKAITSSFFPLIPKKDHPQALSDYRPICLVSSLYKILSNVLTARLKKVLGKLISKLTSKGHTIGELEFFGLHVVSYGFCGMMEALDSSMCFLELYVCSGEWKSYRGVRSRVDSIPFRFLGIPVGANLRRRATWLPIIDSMKRKLAANFLHGEGSVGLKNASLWWRDLWRLGAEDVGSWFGNNISSIFGDENAADLALILEHIWPRRDVGDRRKWKPNMTSFFPSENNILGADTQGWDGGSVNEYDESFEISLVK